jgi:hypothetical protein
MMRVRSPTPRNRVRSQRGGGPSLVLDFLLGVLSKALNFSRATNATVTGQDGVLRWAPANQCVNSATPQAGVAMASAAGTDHNITTGVADAFGGFNAIRIEALTGSCRGTTTSTAYLLGQTVTLSFYAKSTTLPFRLFASALATPNQPTAFDLTGEWVRYVATYVLSTADTNWFYPINQGFAGSTTGVGKFVDICGVQLQPGSVATPYVPTTGAAYYGPRFDYDLVTRAPLGLLIEEGRANLLLQSTDLANAAWSVRAGTTDAANQGIAPDGTTTAALVVQTSGDGYVYRAGAPLSASTTYTLSVYAKAISASPTVVVNAFDGTAAAATSANPIPTTWTRFTHTFITSATVGACDVGFRISGSVLIWGAQLEVGGFVTSYIPTFSSSVYRGHETCSMPCSGWFNAPAGTLVVKGSILEAFSAVTWPVIAQIDDGTGSNVMQNFTQVNGATVDIGMFSRSGNVNQVNTSIKIAVSRASDLCAAIAYDYTAATFKGSGNGSAVISAASGLAPIGLTTLRLHSVSMGPGTGHTRRIKSVTFYPVSLPDATLQQLSAL